MPTGFLVFMMQLGFALLTVGCVQRKSAKSICVKNIMVSGHLRPQLDCGNCYFPQIADRKY